jgi:alcohol dehydrogenase (NADP+)
MDFLGLGTWQSKAGEVKRAVKHYVSCGGRHIDGAAAYGNEAEIGEALAELIAEGVCKREDIFITSKCWITMARPGDCSAALTKTLADLNTSYVDLYLIHWPFSIPKDSPFPPPVENIVAYTPENYLALWRALEAEVDAGRVRALGCSNMSVKKMQALEPVARHPICANQVRFFVGCSENLERRICLLRTLSPCITLHSPRSVSFCVCLIFRWSATLPCRRAN